MLTTVLVKPARCVIKCCYDIFLEFCTSVTYRVTMTVNNIYALE